MTHTSDLGIFIPGNVPSLKNGKDIIRIPIKGAKQCPCCKTRKSRPMITSNKTVKKYAKESAAFYKTYGQMFRNAVKDMPKPLRIGFRFIRGSRHKFDYSNALDTVQDLIVEHGWIPDDNCNEMIPVLHEYQYNYTDPGVYISIEKEVHEQGA